MVQLQLPSIVIDTNVLVSALRSRQGASFALLRRLLDKRFAVVISVPLMMEYESVLLRPAMVPLTTRQVGDVLDTVCAVAREQAIHFLWRPQLRDASDDMVLETVVNGRVDFLVTHNVRDFSGAHTFDVKVMTPHEFLSVIEGAET